MDLVIGSFIQSTNRTKCTEAFAETSTIIQRAKANVYLYEKDFHRKSLILAKTFLDTFIVT